MKVWSVPDGKLQASLEDGGRATAHVAFSPDGSLLAAGGTDGVAVLWDWKKAAVVRRLEGHGEAVHALGFSPDGSRLAMVPLDGTVVLLDSVPVAQRLAR